MTITTMYINSLLALAKWRKASDWRAEVRARIGLPQRYCSSPLQQKSRLVRPQKISSWVGCQKSTCQDMINMENVVEVTPASPPAHVNDLNCNSGPESPEIRVTETPESEACSSPRRSSSPQTSEARAPLIFQPFLPLPGGPHRSLPFSIDNILKPTFGPRTLLQNPAFFSLAAAAASAQQKLMPERQRSPSSSSSSNGSMVKSEQKSPPSSPINHNNNQPVDLSSKNGGNADGKNKKAEDQEGVPPGMVRGPNGQLWPAWVFCTRYSDRPSSGKFYPWPIHKK